MSLPKQSSKRAPHSLNRPRYRHMTKICPRTRANYQRYENNSITTRASRLKWISKQFQRRYTRRLIASKNWTSRLGIVIRKYPCNQRSESAPSSQFHLRPRWQKSSPSYSVNTYKTKMPLIVTVAWRQMGAKRTVNKLIEAWTQQSSAIEVVQSSQQYCAWTIRMSMK